MKCRRDGLFCFMRRTLVKLILDLPMAFRIKYIWHVRVGLVAEKLAQWLRVLVLLQRSEVRVQALK